MGVTKLYKPKWDTTYFPSWAKLGSEFKETKK